MLDDAALSAVEAHGENMAVPWVLMAAFLYYHKDATILSDDTYDFLTTIIRDDWATITHRHRYLVEPIRKQRTSSLYHLAEQQYPTITRSAAMGLLAGAKVQ